MARDSFAAATARLQSTVVKAITGYYRLQDFVHAIRGCKTLGEERTLVVRESAAIRTSFKASETSAEERYHAVAKLLFIHMMGYPAHFGQVESLKMVASPRLSEKRLGYLGSEQLIDETQATLTLITNSMKSDLSSSNPTVSAVAIANLTLTASPDLARDLADEIQHLLQTASPYLRKKAAFCAGRLVRKVPDLADLFESAIYTIVSDKNHGVLLGAISLIESLISVNPMYIQKNRERLIPFFVQHLQNIASSGNYNSDYDVAGVCDPFLQVHILRLMRELSAGDITCSLSIADVLTQVATCTDSSRNSGHAVLYETAVTIMGIEGDAALEAMAVGILGKLLASPSSDPNLRYVSLALLKKAAVNGKRGSSGLAAVQRHRVTIMSCLEDGDPSIKRRAADLLILLITKDTISGIIPELLQVVISLRKYAEHSEYRGRLVVSIADSCAMYAPSTHWYVETMGRLLYRLPAVDDCGDTSKEEDFRKQLLVSFLSIVANTPALHAMAAKEFFRLALQIWKVDLHQNKNPRVSEVFLNAAIWIIGEYADILLDEKNAHYSRGLTGREVSEKDFSAGSNVGMYDFEVTPELLVDLIQGLNTEATSSYTICALGKIVNRLPSESVCLSVTNALRSISKSYGGIVGSVICRLVVEVQCIIDDTALCSILFARVPIDPAGDTLGRVSHRRTFGDIAIIANSVSPSTSYNGVDSPKVVNEKSMVPDEFLQLAALSLDEETIASLGPLVFERDGLCVHALRLSDPSFMDISDLKSNIVPTNSQSNGSINISGELRSLDSINSEGLTNGGPEMSESLNRATLKDAVSQINRARLSVVNKSGDHCDGLAIQCAVPKSMRVSLDPATGSSLGSGELIEQMISITAPIGSTLRLRLRVSFKWRRSPDQHTYTCDVLLNP